MPIHTIKQDLTLEALPASALYTTQTVILEPNNVQEVEVRSGMYDPYGFVDRTGFLAPNLIDVNLVTSFTALRNGITKISIVNNTPFSRIIYPSSHIASLTSPRYSTSEDCITISPHGTSTINTVSLFESTSDNNFPFTINNVDHKTQFSNLQEIKTSEYMHTPSPVRADENPSLQDNITYGLPTDNSKI